MNDYYAILGVKKDATQTEVKAAYLRLSKALHPDVNPHGAALMQAVNAAYEVLGDAKKRAAYDRGGENVRQFPKAAAQAARGAVSYLSPDGTINFVALTASVTPVAMQESVLPLVGRLLADLGVTPQKATAAELLRAAGMLKKKRVRKSA